MTDPSRMRANGNSGGEALFVSPATAKLSDRGRVPRGVGVIQSVKNTFETAAPDWAGEVKENVKKLKWIGGESSVPRPTPALWALDWRGQGAAFIYINSFGRVW